MPGPALGKTAYTNRLTSISNQFATIMEIFQEINDNDPGPHEKLALLMTGINAVIKGVEDVNALQRFGDVFKETGELNIEILKEGKS